MHWDIEWWPGSVVWSTSVCIVCPSVSQCILVCLILPQQSEGSLRQSVRIQGSLGLHVEVVRHHYPHQHQHHRHKHHRHQHLQKLCFVCFQTIVTGLWQHCWSLTDIEPKWKCEHLHLKMFKECSTIGHWTSVGWNVVRDPIGRIAPTSKSPTDG